MYWVMLLTTITSQINATCPLSTCDTDNAAMGTGWSFVCSFSSTHFYVKVQYDREDYPINMYADEHWGYCGGGGGSSTYWFPVYTDYDYLDASYYKTSYEWGEVNGNEVGKESTNWAKSRAE